MGGPYFHMTPACVGVRWGGGEVGVPKNIMRALCVVIRPDHFKFASYGPVCSC